MSTRRTRATVSLAAFVCLVSALNTSTSWADSFGCAIMPKGEGVSIAVRGQVYDAPVRLRDCEGAMVTGGDALVCYSDGDGRRKCRTVEDGAPIDQAALGGQGGREWGAFGILAMLMGDQQVRPGVSKGHVEAHTMSSEGDARAPLPVGDTLSSEARAALGLAPMEAHPDPLDLIYPIRLRLRRVERGEDFHRTAEALSPYVPDVASPTVKCPPSSDVYWVGQRWPRAVKIPLHLLTPGAEYDWEIIGISGGASGAFRIVGAEATAALSAELKSALSDPSIESLARALITADILLGHKLVWDATRLLEKTLATDHLSPPP